MASPTVRGRRGRQRRVGTETSVKATTMSTTKRARCIQLGGVVSVIVVIFYFLLFHNLSSSLTNIQQDEADAISTIPAMKDDSSQQQQWWERYVQGIARPFPPWKFEKYSWCLLKPAGNLGLIFVKNPKAASSTGAGINMRIAHNAAVAKKKIAAAAAAAAAGNITTTHTTDTDSCAQFSKHGGWFRKKKHTLLWTNVRDPAKRSLSQFFHFQVSRRGQEPTTRNMLPHLRAQKGFQVAYMTTGKHNKNKNTNSTTLQFIQIIKKEIVNAFDFIALVERMDESLVVMKLLFDLDDKDMIVLSAKSSGGYDDGKFERKCFFIQKAFTTPEVDEYLTTGFKVDNADYLLYAAANRSLDLTIDALGRKRVEEHVRKHRVLQKLAEDKCLTQAVFPCSANGARQTHLSALDCYGEDHGCGYRCVDRIIQEHYESSISTGSSLLASAADAGIN
jgi:hypothetical protein